MLDMSSSAVAVPMMQGASYNLLKVVGNGNCATIPDVALGLGKCHSTAEARDSSGYSREAKNYCASLKDLSADSRRTDNEDPNSLPAVTGNSFCSNSADGTGLERTGSGISVLSAENTAAQGNEKSYTKLPSSQYKGVVPQPNGRWGAQIYEKHQRIWLGTFNRQEDAARAYDRAAVKFRGADAITNSNLIDSYPEAVFLRRHSKSEIVDMLRKHIYDEELEHNTTNSDINLEVAGSNPQEPHEHLFDKTVTPSDVGKLNRIVIPKHFAEKYFPLNVDVASGEGKGKGILLNFQDSANKTWRFRYSYWNSSQSYVLTKGWSRFVKEKRLQAGDIVTFERSCSLSRHLFIAFRRRRCDLFPPIALSPPIEHCQKFINPFAVAGHSQWAKLFNAPPPPPIINTVDDCSISDTNSLLLMSIPKSVTIDGNSSSLDFVDLRGALPSIDGNSSVRLFGVNLRQLPLDLFPSITAKKRKAATDVLSEVFPGSKRRCYESGLGEAVLLEDCKSVKIF